MKNYSAKASKCKLILISLMAFNAYCMESNKPYNIIPTDVQKLIMHHVIYNDQLTPEEFYNVLLNYAHLIGNRFFIKSNIIV